MAHYQATIEYDGTAFHGFQRQATVRTVQAVLETQLAQLQGGGAVTVRGAGRTDAGVHARGQVVAFALSWRKTADELHHALNTLLPDDLSVASLAPCRADFHPRYEALSRRYRYTVLNTPQRHALQQRFAWHERRPLDVVGMAEAAQGLVGEHDFASFGRPMTVDGPTVRHMMALTVARHGDLIQIELEANAFLFRMVRSIVGALLRVGRGDAPVAWIEALLAARDRSQNCTVVGPQGLCLIAVRYPSDPT